MPQYFEKKLEKQELFSSICSIITTSIDNEVISKHIGRDDKTKKEYYTFNFPEFSDDELYESFVVSFGIQAKDRIISHFNHMVVDKSDPEIIQDYNTFMIDNYYELNIFTNGEDHSICVSVEGFNMPEKEITDLVINSYMLAKISYNLNPDEVIL